MKQNGISPKRQTYVPPRMEIIEIEQQTVLCGSGISGNSIESIGVEDFGWL